MTDIFISWEHISRLHDKNANRCSLYFHRALQSQAVVIKESKSKRSAADSTSSQKPPHNVVYEIYHSSDAEKLESLEKLSVLDERLRRLETVLGIGADTAKISTLTGSTAHKGLLEAAAKMSQASALLDRSHLDQLEARLTALSNRLGQMAERQSELDADTQNRVSAKVLSWKPPHFELQISVCCSNQ